MLKEDLSYICSFRQNQQMSSATQTHPPTYWVAALEFVTNGCSLFCVLAYLQDPFPFLACYAGTYLYTRRKTFYGLLDSVRFYCRPGKYRAKKRMLCGLTMNIDCAVCVHVLRRTPVVLTELLFGAVLIECRCWFKPGVRVGLSVCVCGIVCT